MDRFITVILACSLVSCGSVADPECRPATGDGYVGVEVRLELGVVAIDDGACDVDFVDLHL